VVKRAGHLEKYDSRRTHRFLSPDRAHSQHNKMHSSADRSSFCPCDIGTCVRNLPDVTLVHCVTMKWDSIQKFVTSQTVFDVCRTVHRNTISIVKPTRCTNISYLFYFGTKLNMFRTVFPSIIRSLRLYIQQQVYVIQFLWLQAATETV